MKNMILAAFKLNDLIDPLEIIKTNRALCRLLEENVTEWEMFDVSHYFTVHLPALGYY